MNLEPLSIAGAFLVRPEAITDERGCFVRTFCSTTFAAAGLASDVRQCSASFNTRKYTLRGLHYQSAPYEETKVVRCTRGAAYHVIVDLRHGSASYLEWAGVELNSDKRHMLYVPMGVAHGFITLADVTEISYQMSQDYVPDSACGVRWDDPTFGIEWPASPDVVSDRDAAWPEFRGPGKD